MDSIQQTDPVALIRERASNVIQNGSADSFTAKCPAHDDRKNSLSVSRGDDGRALLFCHARCDTTAILECWGMKATDLFADSPKAQRRDSDDPPWTWEERGLLKARYTYTDETGTLLFEKLRSTGKDFAQRRPDASKPSGWAYRLGDVRRVLYRLPELLAGIEAGETVYVVEGEKDADALHAMGLVATTNPEGAGKWRAEYTDVLKGAPRVAVIPDNDAPGRAHAWKVARELPNAVVCELPDLPDKGDVSDWIAAGGTKAELLALVEAAVANPPDDISVRNQTEIKDGRIANYDIAFDDEGKPYRVAIPITDIGSNIRELTDGWPKRVGAMLFTQDGDEIRVLTKPAALFAFIGERATLEWGEGAALTPKAELHAHLLHASENFRAVEELPHEPPRPRTFYAWRHEHQPTDLSHFGTLCRYFDNCESDHDKMLLTAMFATLFWGGEPGCRPAFVIEAPDRGCGKSTLADVAAELTGGAVDIQLSGNLSDDDVKKRLLSPGALTSRVLRVDNIKGRGASPTLENIITCTTISGHRLFEGEARRPNTLTAILTANTPDLSRDLAERAFFIRLKRPTPRPAWRDELFAYVREHRAEIIGDICELLRAEPCSAGATDRWQTWVDSVLRRCTADPAAIVAENQARRDECDEEVDEAKVIMEAIDAIEGDFIETGVLVEKLKAVTGWKKWTARTLAQRVKGHITAGRLPGVEPTRTNSKRGYTIC